MSAAIGAGGCHGFLSYAHQDREAVSRLLLDLKPAAERELGVSFWTDSEITAGSYWAREIELAIEDTDVFVLCMSPAYLDSQYLYYHEFPAIRRRGDASRALVVPVILRACAWWGFAGDFPVVPSRKGRVLPISDWPSPDAGYHAATVQIIEAMRAHFQPPGRTDDRLPRQIIRLSKKLDPGAPSGPHRLSSEEIDRAVGAVVAARTDKSGT